MAVLVHFIGGGQEKFDDAYDSVVGQLEGDTVLLRLTIAGGETAVMANSIAYVEPVSDGSPVFDQA